MVAVKKFVFNPFQENTYLVFDETKECLIIDPGCSNKEEEARLTSYIQEEGLKPIKVISTHSHIDHILGNNFVTAKYKIPLEIYEEDLQTLQSGPVVAQMYGLPYAPSPEPSAFLTIEEGVHFGNSHLSILFVPGHAPGHIVFYSKEAEFVINGDCLFYGSIGRTDLPGGNHDLLLESIRKELFSLPDNTKVYCGHGPETTIGFEKLNNPFLN